MFDRAAIERVGLFDERLIRNQDYELNIRLRKAGETVWFDHELSVGYRPRGSWRALARQYYEYGYWNAVVIRMHPESARLRQMAPLVAVFGGALCLALSMRWRRFAAVPALAVFVIGAEVERTAKKSRVPRSALLATFVTIPLTWSVGLVVGACRPRIVVPPPPPR